MLRPLLVALAAVFLASAARPPSVDYRLGVQPHAGATPMLTVEMRLRGDADGETRLALPDSLGSGNEAWRYLSDLTVDGATVTDDGPAERVLRHRPNARITVRYRVRTAYDADPAGAEGATYRGAVVRPGWFATLGELVFAVPQGRELQAATFKWGRMPSGWTAASDLEHGAMGRPMIVADVRQSVALGGAHLAVVQRPIPGGVLRVAALQGGGPPLETLADDAARTVAAERAFWNDETGPAFVAAIPLAVESGHTAVAGLGRGDAVALWATPGEGGQLAWTLARDYAHTWIPGRLGSGDAAPWFTDAFTDFIAARSLLRAGAGPAADLLAHLGEGLQAPARRGALLPLKWDEEIRRKTAGKRDLDDVVLRMRDHYRQFPPGKGPDVITGLVSAAWVTAGIDLRPDIARYAAGGAVVPLPEILFDGCVDVRTLITPAFDAGFDTTASFAAKALKGVRRGGPAWNSGLRNGMALDAWTLKAGDTSREVELTVRDRRKPRKVRFWPYGDAVVETRQLALAIGLTPDRAAACARKIGGL